MLRALLNGRIYPNPLGSPVEAMLYEHGAIKAAGSETELRESLKDAERIDLKGRTVLPGLIDAHTHFVPTCLKLTEIDCTRFDRLDELFETMAARRAELLASGSGGDGIVRSFGFRAAEYLENRFPTLAELDAVSPDLPLFLGHYDGHSGFLNSVLLARAIEHEVLQKGATDHHVRAEEYEHLIDLVGLSVDEDECFEAMKLGQKVAFEKGVTTVCALDGWDDSLTEHGPIVKKRGGELDLELVLYHQTWDLNRARAMQLDRIGGCIYVDGSLGSRTAALFEDYLDAPGNGKLYQTTERFTGFIREAAASGMQTAFHAIGDRAVSQILDAYQEAGTTSSTGLKHRIEHFILCREQDVKRAADMGLEVNVQPSFLAFWQTYTERLGKERLKRILPLREMWDAGMKLSAGSDAPITPINPLAGIELAVSHPNPEQSLSSAEAISLFTTGAASAIGRSGELGALTPGAAADFVVLESDPLASSTDIADIAVKETWKRGKRVFLSGDAD